MTATTLRRSRAGHDPGCRCAACRAGRHPPDHAGCGCAKCRTRAREATEFETGASVATTPKIASCDPRRHVFRRMNVVRWNSRRTPCRRNIPAGIDLGILSRARTRIPLSSAETLIKAAQAVQPDRTHWVHRLPRSHLHSLVDLTVELFLQQKPGMSLVEIRDSFKAYLQNRHTTELGAACDRGFFVFEIARGDAAGKASVETRLELSRFGVDLDRLFERANVTPSATRSCPGRTDEMPRRFFLLFYITLPDEMEAKLRPPLPKPKPPVRPSIEERFRQVLEDLRKLPRTARRDRTICMVNMLRKRRTNARYVIEHWVNAYANMASVNAPEPWENTEDAREEFKTAARLAKTRQGFRDSVLYINDSIFAGVKRAGREYQFSGSATRGNTARRMRDWVESRQKDRNSIYSCYAEDMD